MAPVVELSSHTDEALVLLSATAAATAQDHARPQTEQDKCRRFGHDGEVVEQVRPALVKPAPTSPYIGIAQHGTARKPTEIDQTFGIGRCQFQYS